MIHFYIHIYLIFRFLSICCCSVALSCLSLCNPMDYNMTGFPYFSISQSLLKLMSIESVMPFNNLALCHPLLLLPSIFPALGSFVMSQLFASGGQSIGVSASASVLPMNIQDWFPLRLTGLISLQSTGLSYRLLKAIKYLYTILIFFKFVKIFFDVDHFLSLSWIYFISDSIASVLFLLFWPKCTRDLSSPTSCWIDTLCIGRLSLNRWISREVPYIQFLKVAFHLTLLQNPLIFLQTVPSLNSPQLPSLDVYLVPP